MATGNGESPAWAQFLAEVRGHYESRGFSSDCVNQLENTIGRSLQLPDTIVLSGTKVRIRASDVLGRFGAIRQPVAGPDELGQSAAVFCFAFGYRLRPREGDVPEARLPGLNNRHLADVAARLKTQAELRGVPVLAQFEVADALIDHDPSVVPDYSTKALDIGTEAVIDQFVRHLGWKSLAESSKSVIVVAHQRHLGRCLLLLQRYGLNGRIPPGLPSGYDPAESQLRVRDEMEFIHSDFLSVLVLK